MKIIFVCSGKSIESISPIIANQGKSLVKQGIQLEYFPIGGKGFFSYLKAIILLRKRLSEQSFDIIHAHYGLCGIVSLIARKGQKLVVSFMGDDLLGSRNRDGSITIGSKINAKLNDFLAIYFYDHIVVKSDKMYGKLTPVKKISVIPNGVDVSIFKPTEREEALKTTGWNPSFRHIIFVSNHARSEKNFNLAEKAHAYLNNPDVKLHIVHVIPNEQMPSYYSAADVLLLTSFHEGSPNVVKEAMACNCPIVSTDIGDVSLIIGNTNGCYLASFDHKDFGEKIKSALKFTETKIRTKGRVKIIELGLDSETISRKIIEVYKKVLKITD